MRVLKPSVKGRGAQGKRSGRYTTIYHGGKLRRGGVRQYVIFALLLAEVVIEVAYMTAEAFLLSGVI